MKLVLKLFKLSLFTFNSLYFLIGVGLLIGSSFVYLSPNQINDLIKHEYGAEYLHLVYGLNGFALVLIAVGILGCAAVISQRAWLMFMYFFCLFVIFSAQFAGSVYVYMKSVNYFQQFNQLIVYAIKHQYGESGLHSRAIDYLHFNFKCCGWYSPKDWYESNYIDPKYAFNTGNEQRAITLSPSYVYKIPYSCCVNTYDLTCVLMHRFHEVGCMNTIKYYYVSVELYAAWFIAFMNLYQLILLVLSLYVICILFFDKTNRDYEFRKSLFQRATTAAANSEPGLDDNDSQKIVCDDQYYMTSYYL